MFILVSYGFIRTFFVVDSVKNTNMMTQYKHISNVKICDFFLFSICTFEISNMMNSLSLFIFYCKRKLMLVEIAFREISDRGSCCWGNWRLGKLLLGKLAVGEIGWWGNFCWENKLTPLNLSKICLVPDICQFLQF